MIIVTSALAGTVVENAMPDLRSALGRDLLLVVLWCATDGDKPQEHSRGLELLKKLEYDSNHGQFVGRLVVNSVALGSSFDALISDPESGIEVIFGSFGWLRSSFEGTEKHLSIRLRRSAVGARFCDFVADLATKDERIRTSSAITSLRKLAARLRSTSPVVPQAGGPASVMGEANVFFDETVGWYVGGTIDEATASIHVAVDHLPDAPRSSFVDLLALASVRIPERVVVYFGGSAEEPDGPGIQALNMAQVPSSHTPKMKTNLVIVDRNSASVGNRSWFDQQTNVCRPYGTRVAVAIRGTGVGSLFLDRLSISTP